MIFFCEYFLPTLIYFHYWICCSVDQIIFTRWKLIMIFIKWTNTKTQEVSVDFYLRFSDQRRQTSLKSLKERPECTSSHRRHRPPAHPSITGIGLDGCSPGSADAARLRSPLKHLWGASERRYGATSGTNSPRSYALDSDQWNRGSLRALFSRTAATDFFFPPLSLSILPPLIVEQLTAEAQLFTWLCVQWETWSVAPACVCRLRVCACPSANSGCSPWPKLEVIIMYRLACCYDANVLLRSQWLQSGARSLLRSN